MLSLPQVLRRVRPSGSLGQRLQTRLRAISQVAVWKCGSVRLLMERAGGREACDVRRGRSGREKMTTLAWNLKPVAVTRSPIPEGSET